MKSKEEIIDKINGLSFRTIAFMKNIVNITKKYFEEEVIDKENYGEALFSFKVLKENVIKAETRIINLIEDYHLEYDEMKQTLGILMYGREILRASKKCIKYLKRQKHDKDDKIGNVDEIKKLVDIYDIFIAECDVMRIGEKENNNTNNVSSYKERIEEMVINRDYSRIKDNFAYINDYFASIAGKADKDDISDEEIN